MSLLIEGIVGRLERLLKHDFDEEDKTALKAAIKYVRFWDMLERKIELMSNETDNIDRKNTLMDVLVYMNEYKREKK